MLKKSASLILLLYLTLGCFRGYLALFDKGASEPKQIFPCQVSSLPDADREALKKASRPVRGRTESVSGRFSVLKCRPVSVQNDLLILRAPCGRI